MALTKYQAPQIYTPAYNDQVFVYYSDQTAQSGFKYQVRITINSVQYNFDVFKRPDAFMVFDAKEVVKNYISTYFNTEVTRYKALNENITVRFDIWEYYSGATQATTNEIYYAFNACLNKTDFANYTSTDYYKPLIGDYTNFRLFMNDLPLEINVDNQVTLRTDNWFTFVKGLADNVSIAVYDSNNTLIDSGVIAIPTASATDVIRFNLGATAVAAMLSCTILNGYTIEAAINTSTSSSLCDIFINEIKDVCSRYKIYRLYFLKRNGGIAYKTFELLSLKKSNKQTNSVRLNPQTVVAVGGGYEYSARQDQHYNNVTSTIITHDLSLSTDWITETQSDKLEDLFNSPLVWLQDDTDGSYTPVVITDKSFVFNKKQNDKLFNFTVNVQFDFQETRQRAI